MKNKRLRQKSILNTNSAMLTVNLLIFKNSIDLQLWKLLKYK